MPERRRVNIRGILADPDLRRELMVPTLQATQAREGIETSREQAERAYYVVTEEERTAFVDLARFLGTRRVSERRHEMFACALRGEIDDVRFDVARRDFASLRGAPLAYREVGLLSHLFRANPSTDTMSEAYQGVIARPDEPFIRYHWEITPNRSRRPWVTLHKGGDFARFYFDADLVIDWSQSAQRSFHRLRDASIYFKPGLTWPRRTQKGFNLRKLPPGCVFSDKGPAIFFKDSSVESLFLAVANSRLAEFVLRSLTSFGSWELVAIRRFPLATGSSAARKHLGDLADAIHDAKASWDTGNETSTRFVAPWLLGVGILKGANCIATRLELLATQEMAKEHHIQHLYDELNASVFSLYELPEGTRVVVDEVLGERPPEILWPQMEGASAEEKRMEHIFRLLCYVVKRVVEADDDGIVPFAALRGESNLLDRVTRELATLLPNDDVSQAETEIANELKKAVKGYRRTVSIAEWLQNAFFEYHAALYKNRPIFWHIASVSGTKPAAFGALVHYHRFDKNLLAKLRSTHLRDAIETCRREAALADREGRAVDKVEWQAKREETEELDRRLQWIQEGHHEGEAGGERDFRLLTPWNKPRERPQGWDPDLDDGVKVNIEPLQKAGVLRT